MFIEVSAPVDSLTAPQSPTTSKWIQLSKSIWNPSIAQSWVQPNSKRAGPTPVIKNLLSSKQFASKDVMPSAKATGNVLMAKPPAGPFARRTGPLLDANRKLASSTTEIELPMSLKQYVSSGLAARRAGPLAAIIPLQHNRRMGPRNYDCIIPLNDVDQKESHSASRREKTSSPTSVSPPQEANLKLETKLPEESAESPPAELSSSEGSKDVKSMEKDQEDDEVVLTLPPVVHSSSEGMEDVKVITTDLKNDGIQLVVPLSERSSFELLKEAKAIATNKENDAVTLVEEPVSRKESDIIKAAKKKSTNVWKMPRNLLHFSNPVTKNQRQDQYSIRIKSVPAGHECVVVALLQVKMGELGRSLYEANYCAMPDKEKIQEGSIVVGFKRWIDYRMALAIEALNYEGRFLKITSLENKDSVPGLWEDPIVDEIWYKNLKHQDRCFVVWSQKLKYREVQAMIKEVTGKVISFRRPVPLGNNQTGYLLRASSAAELGKIIVKLDGVTAPITGGVLGIRPLINRKQYQTEIRRQARENKWAQKN